MSPTTCFLVTICSGVLGRRRLPCRSESGSVGSLEKEGGTRVISLQHKRANGEEVACREGLVHAVLVDVGYFV